MHTLPVSIDPVGCESGNGVELPKTLEEPLESVWGNEEVYMDCEYDVKVVDESVIVEIGIDVVIVVMSSLVIVEIDSVGEELLLTPDDSSGVPDEGMDEGGVSGGVVVKEELASVCEGIKVEPPLVVHHNCGNEGGSKDIMNS